jgi:hypothetical protein
MSDPQSANDAATASNRDEARKGFFQDVAALGKRAGQGMTALEDLARRVLEAACDRLIEPKDGKDIYRRYAQALTSATGSYEASIKVNASKITKLIELANRDDGPRIVAEAMRLRKTISNRKSLVEGLAQVSREFKKANRDLTPDEIKTALTRPARKEKPAPVAVTGDIVEALAAKNDLDGLMDLKSKIEAAIAKCGLHVIHDGEQQAA